MSQIVSSIGSQDTSIALSVGSRFPSNGILVASHDSSGNTLAHREIISFANAEIKDGLAILNNVQRGIHGSPAMAWPAGQAFSVTEIVPEVKLAPWLESLIDE